MKTVGPKYLKTTAASVGVAALLALTACGGDSPKPADEPAANSTPAEETTPETTEAAPPEETEEAPATDTDTTDETEDSTDDAPAEAELTEIKASSEKASDSVLQHSFEATGIALGLKGSGDRVDPPGNNKYVAVKIKATSGTKYLNGLSCTAFKLKDDRATTPKSSYSLIDDAVKAQGLTPFERISKGESGEGWCTYYLENPTKDNLTLVYSRSGLKDRSTGKQEPPESKELKITPQG